MIGIIHNDLTSFIFIGMAVSLSTTEMAPQGGDPAAYDHKHHRHLVPYGAITACDAVVVKI